MLRSSPYSLSCVALACCLGAHAAPGNDSRIASVTVDPSGATVQRVAKVAAGQKELVLDCVREAIDLNTLQLQAKGDVRLGEVKVQTLDRVLLPECGNPALNQQIRELEVQIEQLDSQNAAIDYALAFLRPGAEDSKAPPRASAPEALTGLVTHVQHLAQSRLLEQIGLQRRKAQLLEQLQPLKQERERTASEQESLRRVSIQVAARTAGQVLISYRTPKAGWTPTYRAYLDTQSGAMSLERRAKVTQASGEDWSGVELRLTTMQPLGWAWLPAPQPWRLDLATPSRAAYDRAADVRPRAAAAPAPAYADTVAMRESDAKLPSFEVSQLNQEYASEFSVPGVVDIANTGQRSDFVLSRENLETQLFARIQPGSGALAHLVTVLPQVEGSWPSGQVELYRDGVYVGTSPLRFEAGRELELFWGADDKLRVQRIPEQLQKAQTGFIGKRQEIQRTRRWIVSNKHAVPINLQLLESAPVSENAEIQVEHQYKPPLSLAAWRDVPGIVGWQQRLNPGQTMDFEAHYVISLPADARLSGLR